MAGVGRRAWKEPEPWRGTAGHWHIVRQGLQIDPATMLPLPAPVLLWRPGKLLLTSQELRHPPLPLGTTTLLKETKQFQRELFKAFWHPLG